MKRIVLLFLLFWATNVFAAFVAVLDLLYSHLFRGRFFRLLSLRGGVATVAISCLILLSACSDNISQTENRYGEWETSSEVPLSSSSSDKVPELVEVTVGSMTDSRDGQIYKTIKIGEQIWMAQNLNYETADSYCYSNNVINCFKYGRLYTWAAAMDSVGAWSANGKDCGYGSTCAQTGTIRGVCPVGWHLPSLTELYTLFTAVDLSPVETKLKSTSGWGWSGNGTDAFAFSALSAGYRDYNGDYSAVGNAYFWSSIENNSYSAYVMSLFFSLDYVSLEDYGKNYGFSVRCLKDDESRQSTKSSSSVKVSSSSVAKSSSSVKVTSSSSAPKLSSSIVEVVNPADVVVGFMTDSRDGQKYKTVKIGTQTWMAENLNYETANSFCSNDTATYCAKYGRLYTWTAAKSACPTGWHLPSQTEWETLWTAVGGQSTAGKVLKSSSGWAEYGNGTDAFLFSALPAGYRYYNGGIYSRKGAYAYFWSSTGNGSDNAYNMFLYSSNGNANLYYLYGYNGCSVRCLKDDVSGQIVKSSSSAKKVSSSSVAKSSSSVKATSSSSAPKPSSSIVEVVDPADVVVGFMTDSRDGQKYKTVKIGKQIWMAQNLNYKTTNRYCYNDSASYCAKYGRLYTWATAISACPAGWHLPSNDEWNTLFTAVGGQATAGIKLKSKSGWYNTGNGTDAYSFSALPAGYKHDVGSYYNEGDGTSFWSSSESYSVSAYYMDLYYSHDDADLLYAIKNFGHSVRCLQD